MIGVSKCTPSLQRFQQSVHSPKPIGESNRTKKKCAPQSNVMRRLQIPIAQEMEQFPIDTDALYITSHLILRDSQRRHRLTESLYAN